MAAGSELWYERRWSRREGREGNTARWGSANAGDVWGILEAATAASAHSGHSNCAQHRSHAGQALGH